MIKSNEIPQFLDEVERLNPQMVHSRFEQGMTFSTHPYETVSKYRVDDPEIHREFGFEEDFGEFLLEVDRRIRSDAPGQVLNHYFPPGGGICDLSRVVREGVGMCLEQSAIVALRKAEGLSSHLVKGVLKYQGGGSFHAFNVIGNNDGIPDLADAQHSIIHNRDGQKIYYPFNFPLEGFDPDRKRFVFQEPYEQQLNWHYHLPFNVKLP